MTENPFLTVATADEAGTAEEQPLGPPVRDTPPEALAELEVGPRWKPDPAEAAAVGRTMFDVPGSARREYSRRQEVRAAAPHWRARHHRRR